MTHKEYLEMLIGPLSGEGGGGTPAVLIDKTVNANGTFEAVNDNADGYQKVVVSVPPYGEGSVNLNTNGRHDVSGKAEAVVSVQPDLQSKSVNIAENGTVNVGPDQGKDGLLGVAVVVAVQGGADAGENPKIPSGYTELKMPNGLKSTNVTNYLAGQTNKQINAQLPLWMSLNVGDKIVITGITTDTNEKYGIAGTVSGKIAYTTYQYAKLTIDYNGMLGSAVVIPTGYTEVKASANMTSSTVLGYTAGQTNKSFTVPHDAVVAVNDKIALTGLTNDTGDEFVIAGTVTNTTATSATRTVYLTIDVNGAVGHTAPVVMLKSNGLVDVRGRNKANVDVHGSGTITISQNGNFDVDAYRYADVHVQSSGGNSVDMDGFTNVQYFQANNSTPNQGIQAVRLPSVQSIADSFNYMYGLTEVYIGPDIASISFSFENCPSLIAVAFDEHTNRIPSVNLGQVSMNTVFYVPDNLVQQWQESYDWQRIATQIQSRKGMPWSQTFAPFYAGEVVTHNNQQWVSVMDYNDGEPGVDPTWDVYQPW